MINKEIIINKKTREIINGENGDLFRLGVDGENLQENIVFKFDDEFVNGTARIEITMQDNTKSYVMINKVNETYVLPVKSILTKTGLNKMQLVITQGTDDQEIPIFKSKMFSFYIADSINADTEQPEEYPQWIDKANTTLNEIDNFDIDAIKELNEATITITDRSGLSKSVKVYDGTDGIDGKDAKINGVNTLSLKAGTNITLEQEDNELTINAQGGSGGGAVNSVNGMTGDVVIDIPVVPTNVSSFNNDAGYLTQHQDISGKQDKIDSSNKLNADLVDDTSSTNKFFSGNYNDLSNKPDLSGYQTIIDTTHKLSADLVDDSSSSNRFSYIGELDEIKDTVGYVDFKKAKKGVYLPNLTGESTQFISSILDDTAHSIFQANYVSIYITKEITNMTTPSAKTYFGYLQGLDTSTGELVYINLYVGTNGVIGQDKVKPINWPKAYYLTNQDQSITGTKTFNSIPQVSSYTAPSNNTDLVAKKYVDDSIASAITTTLGGSF